MRGKIIVCSILTVLSNGVSAGDVFRCVGANGDVSFTNVACPTNSRAQVVATYVPVPDSPAPTYNADTMAAAASASEARRAAQQARAAADQAEAAYADAQTEAQHAPSYGPEYASGWVPYYAPFGSSSNNHRHHRGMIGKPSTPPSNRPMPTPHRQAMAPAPRR